MFRQLFNTNQQRRNNNRYGLEAEFCPASERAYITRDILSQGVGRMRYQATDWNACAADNESIPAGTEVIPVMRRGNTWLVVPVNKSAALAASSR